MKKLQIKPVLILRAEQTNITWQEKLIHLMVWSMTSCDKVLSSKGDLLETFTDNW